MREPTALVINGVVLHPHVTIERVVDMVDRHAATLDDPGICIACGSEASQIAGDAEMWVCPYCNENAVYGAPQLLFYLP